MTKILDEIHEFPEIYGNLQRYVHISREAKNLQYLTDEIFKAAKKDLQLDKANGGNSTEALEAFANKYLKKINPENQEINLKAKEHLMENLSKDYSFLKEGLENTRVFGVGKSATEKLGTVAKNTINVMGKALAGCAATVCVAGAVCLACVGLELKMESIGSLFQGDLFSYWIKDTESHMAYNASNTLAHGASKAGTFALKSTEVNSIRTKMKDVLKTSVANTDQHITSKRLYKDHGIS